MLLYLDTKEIISKTATTSKNTPNRIFSIEFSIFCTSNDVIIAKITPTSEKTSAGNTFVNPLFMLKNNMKNDIITNEKTLITCALFCATPIMLKSGIKTVPPPSPMAPRAPETTPRIINTIHIKIPF